MANRLVAADLCCIIQRTNCISGFTVLCYLIGLENRASSSLEVVSTGTIAIQKFKWPFGSASGSARALGRGGTHAKTKR